MEKAFSILHHVLNDILLRKENRGVLLDEFCLDPRYFPGQIAENNGFRAFLLEIARIISTNLVVSLVVENKLEDVTKESVVSKLSSNVRYFRGCGVDVWKAIASLGFSKCLQHEIRNEIVNLSIYDIARILESIHVITVYGCTEIQVTAEDVHLRLGGANSLKKHRGAFYTPEKVTKFICTSTVGKRIDSQLKEIEEIISGGFEVSKKKEKASRVLHAILDTHVVDPACGPGAFLIQSFLCMAEKFGELKHQVDRLNTEIDGYRNAGVDESVSRLDFNLDEEAFKFHVATRCLYGVDLDYAAAEIASICVGLLAGIADKEKGWAQNILDINIKRGNSLISKWEPGELTLNKADLQELISLRRLMATTKGTERNALQKEYERIIHDLEKRADSLRSHKSGSRFFTDFKSKQPFCWELEFPEIFFAPSGGYDCLVMNPPYDILKPNRSEYVDPKAPHETQRLQVRELNEVRRRVTEEGRFFRRSGQYELALSRVLNLYRLMIERALRITSESGSVGFIVPSTILCDMSASRLRSHILLNYKIEGIYDFPERVRIFEGASQAVSIFLINKAEKGKFVPIASVENRSEELEEIMPATISLTNIEKLSPGILAIPRIRGEAWRVIERIHKHPSLAKLRWIKNRRGELDLTFYKEYVSRENTGTRLIRGNHVERYRLNWNSHEKPSYVRKEEFLKKLGSSPKINYIKMARLAGQQICNMGQEWRLKFCFVEPHDVLANSCNYIAVDGNMFEGRVDAHYLLALFNSRLLNWRFKLTSTNNHVNNYELDALPIKIPDLYDARQRRLYDIIIDHVKKVLSESRCSSLEREIDCAIFLLYGLSIIEMRVVMEAENVPTAEIEALLSLAETLESKIIFGEEAVPA